MSQRAIWVINCCHGYHSPWLFEKENEVTNYNINSHYYQTPLTGHLFTTSKVKTEAEQVRHFLMKMFAEFTSCLPLCMCCEFSAARVVTLMKVFSSSTFVPLHVFPWVKMQCIEFPEAAVHNNYATTLHKPYISPHLKVLASLCSVPEKPLRRKSQLIPLSFNWNAQGSLLPEGVSSNSRSELVRWEGQREAESSVLSEGLSVICQD